VRGLTGLLRGATWLTPTSAVQHSAPQIQTFVVAMDACDN
jgi:hypothetical protein